MIYEKVLDYVKKHNQTIAEFERKCGIGNGVISQWRDNKNLPTLNTLIKIAESTNTRIEQWITEDEEN